MTAAKKKPKTQASDVAVGNRTLEAVLIDLAEQVKANDARYAARIERAEALSADAAARSADAAARSADADARATIALETIAAVSKDLRALSLDFRQYMQRTDARLVALEKPTAAE